MFDGLTTGRVVHYGYDCKAGIVSRVHSKDAGLIDVSVFTHDSDTPVVLMTSVQHKEDPADSRWHWPERA